MSGLDRRLKREAHAQRIQESWQRKIFSAVLAIEEDFPAIPHDIAVTIATYATSPGSGRALRSKTMWRAAVPSAVAAHIRHAMTHYDFITHGYNAIPRHEARKQVNPIVHATMAKWGFSQFSSSETTTMK